GRQEGQDRDRGRGHPPELTLFPPVVHKMWTTGGVSPANPLCCTAFRPVLCREPHGYREASPSQVYGAALLMRFRLTADPGFKSPSLRLNRENALSPASGGGVFRSSGCLPDHCRTIRRSRLAPER